jgi:hypothetical protein
MKLAIGAILVAAVCFGQEAATGLQVDGTSSTAVEFASQLKQQPRDGSPFAGGARLMLYPKWKISRHWSFLGAVQLRTRPYFFEEFASQGYGARADVLQGQMVYSLIGKDRSFSVRVGQMSSAFGSFLLRYDDARNPLIDMPLSYGYYGKGVTNLGLMGAEVDASFHRLDFRAQFTNSSPANRRSIFDNGQYGDWAGGIGLTIVQGVRVGVSSYRGPYLDLQSKYYFRGEAPPQDLPATGYSVELEAARGAWNFNSEIQKFQFGYWIIPTFTEYVSYAELKRTLTPRWYAALRINRLSGDHGLAETVYEGAIGYRPNRFQLLKIGYERQNGRATPGSLGNVISLQLVTQFRALSVTRN